MQSAEQCTRAFCKSAEQAPVHITSPPGKRCVLANPPGKRPCFLQVHRVSAYVSCKTAGQEPVHPAIHRAMRPSILQPIGQASVHLAIHRAMRPSILQTHRAPFPLCATSPTHPVSTPFWHTSSNKDHPIKARVTIHDRADGRRRGDPET
ncbi:hypothetical protein CRG98_040585 [Punica granatum]|uniref:Uncharacterized protein n=1 Tax=Punica granatum TaxID=22663 RepID=A0A2I0I4T3_PUNGR|nr:hypothetical protein CRG98_040585 [Punica granatum]